MKHFFIFSFICSLIVSCKNPKVTPPAPLPEIITPIDTSGILDIHITHVVNGTPLVLGTSNYTNANNDTFTVNIFKYYLSNVELKTATGQVYKEPESYFLINHANPNSLHLMIKKVPRANYSSISFLIGVDSLRNTSGAQTGALDPNNDMFWSWNQGYIMAKMEGQSPQSGGIDKKIVFHIGGYTGQYKGIEKVTLNFPNSANVTKTHTPVLNLEADLGKWFYNPNTIDFNKSYGISSPSSKSKAIADNYANMFNVISIVN